VVAETQLLAGDILCMFTDGVTETVGSGGEEFGERRLLDVLQRDRNAGAARLVQNVQRAVHEFRSGEQSDDLTMVVARAR